MLRQRPHTDNPTARLGELHENADGQDRHADEVSPFRCLGMPQPVVTASTSLKHGCFYPVDPSKGALVLTLPPGGADESRKGQKVTVHNYSSSANAITVKAATGETVGLAASQSIAAAGGWAICQRVNRRAWAWLRGG